MEEVLDPTNNPMTNISLWSVLTKNRSNFWKIWFPPFSPLLASVKNKTMNINKREPSPFWGSLNPSWYFDRFPFMSGKRPKIFAHELKRLCDELYPDVSKIRVILDNLNTHKKVSLCATFEPETTSRIAKKLEFIYTPKHGSWLNAIEIEFSILERQCLDRRIGSLEKLSTEVCLWEQERNQHKMKVDWQFTTEDARNKRKRLFPLFG